MTTLGLVTRPWTDSSISGYRSRRLELRDGAEDLAAMPQQNAQVLQILFRQIADDGEVDRVVGEALGVLGQAELSEPLCNPLHRHPPADFASFCPAGVQLITLPSERERGQRVALPSISAMSGLEPTARPALSAVAPIAFRTRGATK